MLPPAPGISFVQKFQGVAHAGPQTLTTVFTPPFCTNPNLPTSHHPTSLPYSLQLQHPWFHQLHSAVSIWTSFHELPVGVHGELGSILCTGHIFSYWVPLGTL